LGLTARGGAVDEGESFAVGADGTRLYVHQRPRRADPAAVRGVLCDGILCDGFIWKYLWEDLAGVLPLVHWHYRGHGRSAPPADPERIDVPSLADDLDGVRRHVGDPPCVLFGHSMGCQVVLEAFRQRPRGIRGLVLLCGSFGHVTSTFHGSPLLELVLPTVLDAAQRAPDLVRAIWSRIPERLALKVALTAGEVDRERLRAEDMMPYLAHMTHVDFPMFLRMLRAAGRHTAGDILAAVDVPVLVIAGERDTFTPPFLAQAMASALPRGELLMVPGGTHVAPLEQHALVNERISAFLRERVL
jgi:pimeloyl-ACP methyl ester carboxylesterase